MDETIPWRTSVELAQSGFDPFSDLKTTEFCDQFEPCARKGRSARLDRMSRNDVVIMLVRAKGAARAGYASPVPFDPSTGSGRAAGEGSERTAAAGEDD